MVSKTVECNCKILGIKNMRVTKPINKSSAAIVQWLVLLVCNHEVTGSNPTPVRFESNVSALSELSINCTMAWVADRQVRAMLYATLAVS